MNTIILLVGKENNWSPDKWIIDNGGKVTSKERLIIETSVAWLSVSRCDDVLNDYDDIEKKYIFRFLDDPKLYLIEWKGEELLKKFIAELPHESEAVIDNDHGLICSVKKLKGLPLTSWIKVKKIV